MKTAILLALSVSLQAGPILSENFNELTSTYTVTSAGAFHAINGTNVDIIGENEGPPWVAAFAGICQSPESGNCIDLDGTGGKDQGEIQAEVFLAPGIYDLSFDLIGAGGPAYSRDVTTSATAEVGSASCLGCLYDETFTLGPLDVIDGIVTDAPLDVTHAGHYFITFSSDTPGAVGALLDNVVLSLDPPAGVPEPSSGTLGALGIGAMVLMGGLLRKRR
jgi:hypothetical protein